MADQIFGGGMHDDVDAVAVGFEVKRARPGVVEDGDATLGMGGGGDGRHVLDLKGVGAGALHVYDFSIGSDQLGNAGADQRIVIGGLDAEPLQLRVAERARRLIGGIGHQDMVAGRGEGKEGAGDGTEAGGDGDRPVGFLEGRDGLLQRKRRRCSIAAVINGVEAVLMTGVKIRHAVEEDGRGMVDGRIDDALMGLGVVARMGGQGAVAPFHDLSR